MKKAFTAQLALLACAGLLACGEVAAQARGAPVEKKESAPQDPVVERVIALTELDSWLRRLVGRFRITTIGQPIGQADCASVGAGPGVHCIYRFARPGRDAQWQAQVRLFGLDLDAPGVGYLRLNGDSTAEGGVAKLRGDAIFFLGDCPAIQPEQSGPTSVSVLACHQELRMQAPPGKAIRIRNRINQYLLIIPPRGRPFHTRTSFTLEWQLEPVR